MLKVKVDNRQGPLETITTLLLSAEGWRDWVQTPSKPFLPPMPALTNIVVRLPRVRGINHRIDLATLQLAIPADMRSRLLNLGLAFDWSARHILKFLQQCTNVEVLGLNFGDGAFGEQRITLPKIQRVVLILRLPTQEETFVLFSEKTKDGVINKARASYLADFLRGDRTAQSTIRSLSIENATFPENTLLEVLRDLSSLQHLSLRNVAIDDNLFHKLRAASLLPELRTLDIEVSEGSDWDGFMTFIEERGIALTRYYPFFKD
ncbi:hypothetical protein FA13DRAFT_1742734 [Coprinellus micaceus]|uniref:F-box domain-containing protein n=1 Tax=Coprinellus micaceus TaxID=71717 RepID=A0A4Y7SGF5_COPMI|nr:hypothetical protein FA13DRAFT_1742734 [Coprinellus micaceus]